MLLLKVEECLLMARFRSIQTIWSNSAPPHSENQYFLFLWTFFLPHADSAE